VSLPCAPEQRRFRCRSRSSSSFSLANAQLFKAIFARLGAGAAAAKAVRPIWQQLAAAHASREKQCTAAELLGGMARGSLRWAHADLCELWAWLTPLISHALLNVHTESVGDWMDALRFAVADSSVPLLVLG
jgi:cytochrome c551/c552